MQKEMKLDYLIQAILEAMADKKFGSKILKDYRNSFNCLKRIAEKMGIDYPSKELLSAFQEDAINIRTGKYSKPKERHRARCIKLLTSLMENDVIDWSRKKQEDISALLKEPSFRLALERFISQLEKKGLSISTICSYKRIVSYFLIFCQEKGYADLRNLQPNNVTAFIMFLYQSGYFRPSTIGGPLSGLRQFLSDDEYTKQFLLELPIHLPRERKIIEVYEEQELSSIKIFLSENSLSKRDTAICKLLLETGLRGVDVCELKLTDIDWIKDVIYIVQDKTNEPLNIPLRSSYGNAIVDYILHERPDSDSEYLFLRSIAPFEKLDGAGSIRRILGVMEEKANVKKEGRIIGSRMTRHNAASTMLRAGVPRADISAALGHKDPNVVSVYLSTDEKTLAACTLPMPVVSKRGI